MLFSSWVGICVMSDLLIYSLYRVSQLFHDTGHWDKEKYSTYNFCIIIGKHQYHIMKTLKKDLIFKFSPVLMFAVVIVGVSANQGLKLS